jgi:hypothetical protein
MSKKLKPNAVELHPATDAWMQGDRYGSICARRVNGEVLVRMDKSNKLYWVKPSDIFKEFSRI